MNGKYIQRVIDKELDSLLPSIVALAIEGAKGVGKTATAGERAKSVFRLDEPEVSAILKADPQRILSGNPPILIDEWQRLPWTWDLVRREVDKGFPGGKFLLTGSASPTKSETHSGAGRILSLRMRPMTLTERGVCSPTVSIGQLLKGSKPAVAGTSELKLEDYCREILQSGFPGIRPLKGRPLRAQLDSYLFRIADRDFAEMGHKLRNPAALMRWMRAYAGATSTIASYESIRDAATGGETEKPSKTTTQPFRDILEKLWIIEPIPAWHSNEKILSGLAKSPKHQWVDPALPARLLGLDLESFLNLESHELETNGRFLGQLFESLCTLSLRVFAQAAEAQVRHLRLAKGEREIDLIVERADGRVLVVEVKLSHNIGDDDVRHLRWFQEAFPREHLDSLILTTGTEAYRRADGIAVVPLSLIGP